MNKLKLSQNKQLGYDKKIIIEYYIKITKTIYNNKNTNKCYSRYKIKIPGELRRILEKQDYIFFSYEDNTVHITTNEPSSVIHKAKIQKYCHDKRVEYNINLSKKVFNLDSGVYFYWRIIIKDNKLIDSVAEIVEDAASKKIL